MIGEIIPEIYDATGKQVSQPFLHRKGPHPTFPIGRSVSQPLTVKCNTLRDVRRFLIGCEYVSDKELFGKNDYWQPPEEFEMRRKGDCEDFAFWTWRQLLSMGYDARFVGGSCGRYSDGHAWVEYFQDGKCYLLEPLYCKIGRHVAAAVHVQVRAQIVCFLGWQDAEILLPQEAGVRDWTVEVGSDGWRVPGFLDVVLAHEFPSPTGGRVEDRPHEPVQAWSVVAAKKPEALTSVNCRYNAPVMSFLRYLMLLSLVVWIGGLIFFAFVLAPTAFQVLPNTHLAGNMVGRALGKLHWIAIISGIVFLISSMLYSRVSAGTAQVFAMRHVLICLMLALTLFSQFWIIPRMDTLRAQVGDFATVPLDNPARVQFDVLHVWSTRVEGAVLLLGLVVVYLATNAFHQR